MSGNILYHNSINLVTVLHENKRCSKPYAALLERFRLNKPTLDDIKAINKRLLTLDNNKPTPDTKFVFPINKDREALNDYAFRTIAKLRQEKMAHFRNWEQIGLISIVMDINLKDGNRNLSISQLMMLKAYIRNSSEKSLKKMSGYLNIVIGGPAIINYN